MLSRAMEFTMTTAVVLSEFMVFVGVTLISVLAALHFFSPARRDVAAHHATRGPRWASAHLKWLEQTLAAHN
jgi:hypothetical protein